jgi:hypothetical protein
MVELLNLPIVMLSTRENRSAADQPTVGVFSTADVDL